MPMIGNQATQGRFLELDSLTASATDDYTLQLNGANFSPESVNNLLVSINGVIQGSSTMSLNGAVLTVGATLSSSDTIDFVRVFGNVGTVSTPTDGSVTANKIGTGAVDLTSKVSGVLPVANGGTGHSTFHPQTALIADTKSQNTAGGTFTQDAWRTRTLNTEISDLNNICSLSSDIFTLSSGTYLIEWTAPAYGIERHQTRLYDTTNSAVIQYGGSNYASSSNAVENSSSGSAIVVISSNTGYKIEHRCETTRSSQGFGVEANLGTEVYAQVKITKIG